MIDEKKMTEAIEIIKERNEKSKLYQLKKDFFDSYEVLFQYLENEVDKKLADEVDVYMGEFISLFFKRLHHYISKGK